MAKQKIKVLYLDDRKENQVAFKAAFRRYYHIFLASTPETALNIIENDVPPIVVADYKMPMLNGVEFFELLVKNHPDIIRIMLTGHAGNQAIIDAINRGEVYRFVSKPWKEEEVVMAIENAHLYYKAKKELEQKNEALEQSYKELDEFIYSSSHDLSSPLMSMKGIVNLAKEVENQEEYSLHLSYIEKSLDKMTFYVKNLIDFHLNKRSPINITDVHFNVLIRDITQEHLAKINKQNIQILTEIDQKRAKFLNDYLRIKIIIKHLFSNAIKFQKNDSPDKKVHISVQITQNRAILTIKDNGIGIDKKYISNIFDMFFRAPTKEAGSGIGLAIVKSALQTLNGKITFNSTPGKGTKVRVVIPAWTGQTPGDA